MSAASPPPLPLVRLAALELRRVTALLPSAAGNPSIFCRLAVSLFEAMAQWFPQTRDPSFSFEAVPVSSLENNNVRVKRVGDYILGDLLGEGSYGKVKEGIHSQTLRRVAVKIYKLDRLRRFPGAEDKIKKEVAILKSLRHPNVISLVETMSVPSKGKIYVVMEYVGGGTLMSLQKLMDDGRFSPSQASLLFSQLLDGLEYLHSKGIVHGDIKPDNMLITTDGLVKISDFGSSIQLSTYTFNSSITTGGNFGSPAFYAPEVALGHDNVLGYNTDMWAAGVTLFYMMFGDVPFKGSSLSELFDLIASPFPVQIPSSFCSYAPVEAQEVMLGCLQKEPASRWTVEQAKSHPWIARQSIVPGSPQCRALFPQLEDLRKRDRTAKLIDMMAKAVLSEASDEDRDKMMLESLSAVEDDDGTEAKKKGKKQCLLM